MDSEKRLERMVAQYVDRRLAGGEPQDPALLCREHPELLAGLRARILRFEQLTTTLSSGGEASLHAAAARLETEFGFALTDFPSSPDPSAQASRLAPGAILGRRYRVRELLGRGGQGEVWRAVDLKLRADVALKTLLADRTGDPDRVESMREEVRSARLVVSPNVCRIYDLVEIEDRELVSMEFVDGVTLAGLLEDRGPLDLAEAADLASQLLAGLEAIHKAGLVHRDIKPENVMVTRAGRVVIMDLGLAKRTIAAADGSVAGTLAYMPPEQMRGGPVDARSDVYAAGIVLAEMIQPRRRPDIRESRKSFLEGVRSDPPEIAESLWARVLRRAVAKAPDDRYDSAQDLARALERLAIGISGPSDLSPYPGLASFTESEADYFFGREAEVEALWKRLGRPPRLLAVVGPSGSGKSSFLRAGVVAMRPEGWTFMIVTPGGSPFTRLAEAAARADFDGRTLLESRSGFDDPDLALEYLARWRATANHALLVVDQFEELFTQNPSEVQSTFASILGRLPLEADVHVVLGMRDDFLLACHEHESLAPLFADLTPLKAPTGTALRRALIRPALQCGFRFEDDELVDAMLDDVADEQSALPLLAFAAANLWERRDRERGLLTRAVYDEIGGVGGALAGHAEATLARIGRDRLPLVREIFRNLVTASGTRADRDRRELLSVFGESDRARAGSVIDELVDSRLLVSFEAIVDSNRGEEAQRLQIVHESLLAAWPRLVHWQTQDADAAQMRDQVRQASRLWDEKGRPEELLWTGPAFRELQVWRERYPGRLSDVEQSFVRATATLSGRRRRRRAWATATALAALAAIALTLGLSWRASERARAQEAAARARAEEQARRAEASKLLALGRLEQDSNPTAALAYSLASLELADETPARIFALETLWRAPTAFALPGLDRPWVLDFSPDGLWLASGHVDGSIQLWSRDGSGPRRLQGHQGLVRELRFTGDSRNLISASDDGSLRIWSVEDGREERRLDLAAPGDFWLRGQDTELVTSAPEPGASPTSEAIRALPLAGGPATLLARLPRGPTDLSRDGRWLVRGEGQAVRLYRMVDLTAPAKLLGSHTSPIAFARFRTDGESVATCDQAGEVRIWNASASGSALELTGSMGAPCNGLAFDTQGTKLAAAGFDGAVRVWRLDGPRGAQPLVLRRGAVIQADQVAFTPDGRWIATSDYTGVALWPLDGPYPYVLGLPGSPKISGLAVAPDGSWVAGSDYFSRVIRAWPLRPGGLDRTWRLASIRLAVSPDGRNLLTGSDEGRVALLPTGVGASLSLPGLTSQVWALAMSRDGRRAAAGGGQYDPRDGVVRVWDLDAGTSEVLDPGDGGWVLTLAFLPDGRLLASSASGVRLWSVGDRTFETLREGGGKSGWLAAIDRDGEKMVSTAADFRTLSSDEVRFDDLARATSHPLPGLGRSLLALGVDPSGEVAIGGDVGGVLKVVRTGGGDPQLLFGHTGGMIWEVKTTSDGRWIVSAGNDGTIRIWPMPSFDKSPLQDLPRERLLELLRSLTNVRVAAAPASATGYVTKPERFPGWEVVPTW